MITETATVEKSESVNATIRIYTTSWCSDCYRAKSFLKQRGVKFEEVNIEQIEGAAEFVISSNQGKRRVPTFEVNGRTFHCSPYDPRKLARELGLEEVPVAP